MTEELPEGWVQVLLGDVCSSAGKVDPRQHPDQEFEYIDIGGVLPGSGRISETKRVSGADAPSRARQLVCSGDVVLSTVRTYQRKTAIVPLPLDGAVASTGFSVLRPHPEVLSEFILYQTLSHEFVTQLNKKQTGTSYPAVRDRDIRAMSIRLSPRDEQRRIVAAIEEHFSRLDAVDSALELAQLRSAQLLESALYAGICQFPSQEASLASFLTQKLCNGRSVPTANGDGRPVLRLTCLQSGLVDVNETKLGDFSGVDHKKYQIEPDDFLISRGNGSIRLVGVGGLVPANPPPVAFPDTLIRARVDRSRLRPEFLRLIWNSRIVRRQLEGQARTTAGIYKVNQTMIGGVSFPTPSPEDQDRLIQEMGQVREVAAELEAGVSMAQERSKSLRRSILADAFSGRLVSQDPNDEPASALLDRISDFQ